MTIVILALISPPAMLAVVVGWCGVMLALRAGVL